MTNKERKNKERKKKAKEIAGGAATLVGGLLWTIAKNVIVKKGSNAAGTWMDNLKK